MKDLKSNNTEEKTATIKHLKVKREPSQNDKNQNPDQEKTQEHRLASTGLTQKETKDKYNSTKSTETIEDAEIVTKSMEMDEIIKNSDKFETIRVIMEILCKELGIPVESQMGEIHKALRRVTEDYYKAMDEFKNLTKSIKR